MKKVFRTDSVPLAKPVRMDNGFLKCDGILTRHGIFEYKNPDGSIRREYRPKAEVFKKDSLDSLNLCPLTIGHPGVLTAQNTKRYAVGSVANVRQDGEEHVAGTIMVTDEVAIEEVNRGRKFLSVGYHTDMDETPGVTEDGQAYDAIQTNIRGNHVALVMKARAGENATLRLDGDEETETMKLKLLKLDGIEVEVDETHAGIISKAIATRDVTIDETKAEVSKQQARADAAEEKLEEAKKASSPEAIREAVTARVSLLRTAEKVLPTDHKLKLDEMGDAEIKKAVIIALNPSSKDKVEKADETYIQARFDAAIESHKPPENEGLNQIRFGSRRMDALEDEGGEKLLTPDQARKKMIEENKKLSK